jgi:hypothetical protein
MAQSPGRVDTDPNSEKKLAKNPANLLQNQKYGSWETLIQKNKNMCGICPLKIVSKDGN